jgi:hypothetical protein
MTSGRSAPAEVDRTHCNGKGNATVWKGNVTKLLLGGDDAP